MKEMPKWFFAGVALILFTICFIQAGVAEEYADKVTQEFHTVVDFYTNIKGIEYVYCAGYLILFPILYKYIFKK